MDFLITSNPKSKNFQRPDIQFKISLDCCQHSSCQEPRPDQQSVFHLPITKRVRKGHPCSQCLIWLGFGGRLGEGKREKNKIFWLCQDNGNVPLTAFWFLNGFPSLFEVREKPGYMKSYFQFNSLERILSHQLQWAQRKEKE